MDAQIDAHIACLGAEQRRLLRLLAGGATGDELGFRLGLSLQQARQAVAVVLAALGVRTTAEAALLWWSSRAGARPVLRRAAWALVA